MRKKTLTAAAAILLAAALLFIPAVQSFAVDALSIFRVGDAKTITITPADLEQIAKSIAAHKESAANDTAKEKAPATHMNPPQNQEKSQPKTLADIGAFTAFDVKLPRDLADQTPEIRATDSHSETIKLEVAALNEKLAKLGSKTQIDPRFEGTEITVTSPPAVTAAYADVVLIATQRPDVQAPADVKAALWAAVCELPDIPESIRSQLRAIDPETRDIYLPVILGVGRETEIGSAKGYLYTMADVAALKQTLPADMQSGLDEAAKEGAASCLIWTNGGVLYVLAGEKDDAELSAIARSMR